MKSTTDVLDLTKTQKVKTKAKLRKEKKQKRLALVAEHQKALGEAIVKGDLHTAEFLLDRIGDLSDLNIQYQIDVMDYKLHCVEPGEDAEYTAVSPVALAVFANQPEMVKLLLKHRSDPNQPYHRQLQVSTDYPAITPLQKVIEENNGVLLNALLEGPTVHHATVSKSALFSAIAVDLDCKTFKSLYCKIQYYGFPLEELLCLAIYYERKEIIQFLLDQGANPTQSMKKFAFESSTFHIIPYDLSGSPLHNAVDTGNPTILQMLLDRGASPNFFQKTDDPNYCEGWGPSLLMQAASRLAESVTQGVIDSVAPSKARLPFVRSLQPLLQILFKIDRKIASPECYLNLMKFLLKKGADWNYIAGNTETVESILSRNALFKPYLDELLRYIEEEGSSFERRRDCPKRPFEVLLQSRRTYEHHGVALISRLNEKGQIEFLLGQLKSMKAEGVWTIPGGRIRYRQDSNLLDTAIRTATLQIDGLSLSDPHLRNRWKPMGTTDFLFGNAHYQIEAHMICFNLKEGRLLNRTLRPRDHIGSFEVLESDRFSENEGIHSNFCQGFATLEWVPSSELTASRLNVGRIPHGVPHPALTTYQFKEQSLAPVAASLIAKVLKDQDSIHVPNLPAAAYLQFVGKQAFLDAIVSEDQGVLDGLLEAGLTNFSNDQNPLESACEKQKWKILRYLLNSILVKKMNPCELQSVLKAKYSLGHSESLPLPEDIVLKWLECCNVDSLDRSLLLNCCICAIVSRHQQVFVSLFPHLKLNPGHLVSIFRFAVSHFNLDIALFLLSKHEDDPKQRQNLIVEGLQSLQGRYFSGMSVSELENFLLVFNHLLGEYSEPSKLQGTLSTLCFLYHAMVTHQEALVSEDIKKGCLYTLQQAIRQCPLTSRDGCIYGQTYLSLKIGSGRYQEANDLLSILLEIPFIRLKHYLYRDDNSTWDEEFVLNLLSQQQDDENFKEMLEEEDPRLLMIPNSQGQTLLHRLAMIHEPEIINLIFRIGKKCAWADGLQSYVNIQDREGCTALHRAIQQKNYHLMDALIQCQADPQISDSKNQTVWDMAFNTSDEVAVRFLQSLGQASIGRGGMSLNTASVSSTYRKFGM